MRPKHKDPGAGGRSKKRSPSKLSSVFCRPVGATNVNNFRLLPTIGDGIAEMRSRAPCTKTPSRKSNKNQSFRSQFLHASEDCAALVRHCSAGRRASSPLTTSTYSRTRPHTQRQSANHLRSDSKIFPLAQRYGEFIRCQRFPRFSGDFFIASLPY